MLKKHVYDYNKKFVPYLIICKCKLISNDLTYNFKFKRMYNINRFYFSRRYLITKIECFTRQGHIFSHISEMSFSFITKFNNMTYKYYLKQPKSMLEWRLIEKLARNRNLISSLNRFHIHPLIQKYSYSRR